MNAYLSFTIGILCIFMLSACDHYSERMVQNNAVKFAGITPAAGQGNTFKDYLAMEYYNLAQYEQKQMFDYKAASLYLNKSERLQAGAMVSPETIPVKGISPVAQAELNLEREKLIAALTDYAIPENRIVLALAQTRFDCWLDQAQEWPDAPEKITCKSQYYENMGKLVLPNLEAIENYNFDGA